MCARDEAWKPKGSPILKHVFECCSPDSSPAAIEIAEDCQQTEDKDCPNFLLKTSSKTGEGATAPS